MNFFLSKNVSKTVLKMVKIRGGCDVSFTMAKFLAKTIDIERRKKRLLKFCYVPATSAAHNRLLFFLFLLRPFAVLMKQTRQAVCAVKQSIFLDVYGKNQVIMAGIYAPLLALATLGDMAL